MAKLQNISINGFELKMLAIIAMTIDHIGWIYISMDSWLSNWFHFIGRLTAPLMCFFLVEGFYFTKDIKKYALRLFLFALISQIPFTLMFHSWQEVTAKPSLFFEEANMLFSLLNALLALSLWQSRLSQIMKIVLTAMLLALSVFMDWKFYVIVFVLTLAYFRGNRPYQIVGYIIVAMAMLLLTDVGVVEVMPILMYAWFPLGILIPPIFWLFYNGQRGSSWGGKYFFYAYYPIHMVILVFIAEIMKWRVV